MLTLAVSLVAGSLGLAPMSGNVPGIAGTFRYEGREGKCAVPALSLHDYQRAADSLEAAEGRIPAGTGYPQLQGSSVGISLGRDCLTVIAVEWDGELSGGVVVLDDSGRTVVTDPSYPGARDVMFAGPARLSFVFTVNKGSGTYDARHVVLCALSDTAWVECFSAPAHKMEIISGSNGPGPDLMYEEWAELLVRHDTAFVNRRIAYRTKWQQRLRPMRLPAVISVLPAIGPRSSSGSQ